jgi:hypothetical protein
MRRKDKNNKIHHKFFKENRSETTRKLCHNGQLEVSVRDHKGMGCNVALIKCTWVRENPKGVGISEGRVQGARWGTGGVSLQATWD